VIQAYPCPREQLGGVAAMVIRWIKTLVRRMRIARYDRREFEQTLQDRRSAEHVERVRQGIKDPGSYLGS
jgi:hypothetical protein